MRFYGTTERTDDNEQTTVSAQKNAIFSSQRFFGSEKKIREETQLCALIKPQCFLSQRFYGQRTNDDNKEKRYYFRLKDKTKLTNNKKNDKSSEPNNQIETDVKSMIINALLCNISDNATTEDKNKAL